MSKIDQAEMPAAARNQWDRLKEAGMWPVALVCKCGKVMVQAGNSDSPLADIWASDHLGEGHDLEVIDSWAEEQTAQEERAAEGVVITAPEQPAKRLIIKPGALIDGTGSGALHSQAVVIEHGRITWVGPLPELAEDLSDAEIVDAPNATLLPGLIDAHVHVMCPAAETRAEWHYYTAASDQELLLRAAANAQSGLWAGVTTMRDLGSRGFLLTTLREEIKAGRIIGPRLLVAGPAMTTTGGHFWYMGYEADTTDQLVTGVRTLHKGGVDVIKIMATGGHTTPGSSPQHSQYSAEQLKAVVDDAHRLGHQVTAHVHAVQGIRNAVEAGVDGLEHCSWLGPDGPAYDPDLASEIADRGIYVSLAMSGRPLDPNKHDEDTERLRKNREARYEAVRGMLELGCRIIDSSDAGMVLTHTHDYARTLVGLVERVGLRQEQAIHLATGAAAEALDLYAETGTIQTGRAADLLLVDGEAWQDITALQRPLHVWREGKTVFQKPQVRKPAS